MSTFLFDSIAFGPVRSRRLGVSLGVNLLPTGSKVCSFNCIYCECGWTKSSHSRDLPSREDVKLSLEKKLKQMAQNGEILDVITFAGNGEPTLHPNFSEIINDSISLRGLFAPNASIAVLSNSTYLHKPIVVEALKRVDQNILKLDSAIDDTINTLNQPKVPITAREIINRLKQFDGMFTLQTLFVRGEYKGKRVDNASPEELKLWLKAVKELKPKEVMVYTIARSTPTGTLFKVSYPELATIAARVKELGIPVQISG